MNRRGHAGRTDENHLEISAALLAAGCSVQSLSVVGLGCPDIIVGYAGINILIEIKNPRNKPSDRALTPDEKKWHARWKGSVYTVETAEEALRLVVHG